MTIYHTIGQGAFITQSTGQLFCPQLVCSTLDLGKRRGQFHTGGPVGAVLGGPFAAARFEVLARPVRRSCRLPPIGPQIMRRPASGLAQASLVASHEAAIETCSVRNPLRTGQQRCGSAFLRQHAILKGSKHFRSQKLMAFWSLQNSDTLRS